MKTFFKTFIDSLLFSNLFMALCAVAQALVTLQLIGAKPTTYPLFILLFVSTIFTYNLNVFAGKPKEPQASPFLRVRWFFKHNKVMVLITIISGIVLMPLFFLLSPVSQILLVFLSVLSIGYGLPIFSIRGKKFGLRSVPGIKSLMIALVWTVSGVLLPIFEAERAQLIHLSLSDEAILFAKRFVFIFALTIPFDIRDLFQDSIEGVKTIPVIFGEKKAYLFCQALLAIYMVLLFLFRGNGFSPDFFALGLTTILTGWLIFKSEWEKDEYYYFFYMDGILILQYVILLAFKFIP